MGEPEIPEIRQNIIIAIITGSETSQASQCVDGQRWRSLEQQTGSLTKM